MMSQNKNTTTLGFVDEARRGHTIVRLLVQKDAQGKASHDLSWKVNKDDDPKKHDNTRGLAKKR